MFTRAAACLIACSFVMGAADAQGLLPEDPEEIAKLPSLPTYRAFLPLRRDLSAGFPTPGNQGKQGSCVGWAVGYALRAYYDHSRRHTSFADPRNLFSPAYIYNQTVSNPADCNSGTQILRAMRLLQQKGAARLVDFPYDANSCRRLPDTAVDATAAGNRIFDFTAIRPASNLDDIKGRIAAGHPVVVGLDVDQKLLSHLSAGEIYSSTEQEPSNGHAVTLVGYDDTLQAFKFINSWGVKWADHGFGWISYTAYAQTSHAAFTITDLPPPPSPEPLPEPPKPPAPQAVAWKDQLASTAERFSCARIQVRSTDEGHGSVDGWVGSEQDLATLKGVLAQLAGSAEIRSDVQLRPWPQCEALMTLDDARTHRSLQLAAAMREGSDYERGSHLVLRVRTPSFPTYLYVAYLQAGGDAVYLYRPSGPVPSALPPNATVTLGGDADSRKFKIGPPFGREMVVAIASASPLFGTELSQSMTEREYLSELRKALLYKPDPKQPGRVVDAATLTLTTHEASQP